MESATTSPAENLTRSTNRQLKQEKTQTRDRSTGNGLDIRLVELPFSAADHGLPPHSKNTDSLSYHLIISLTEASGTPLQEPHEPDLSRRLRAPTAVHHQRHVLGWTLKVGYRLGIPRIQFCTCRAYGTSIYYSLWTHLPHNHTHADEFVLPDMPHVTLQLSQLPQSFL